MKRNYISPDTASVRMHSDNVLVAGSNNVRSNIGITNTGAPLDINDAM